jgi:hypothetical protein
MKPIHEFLKEEWIKADLRIKNEKLAEGTTVVVLFGDFSFYEGTMGETSKAIVNRIDKKTTCKIKNLDVFCEEGLEDYESYLIPELYNGKIVYQE